MEDWMGGLQKRVEGWVREQGRRIKEEVGWPPQWRWPPWQAAADREEKRRAREEYARKRAQLQNLCAALKADSLPDMQDVLCSMVLSECVYKRPASEMIRFVNKFKADFGGQVVSLERVQPSLDHVPHRYLLAEAGDTLFASFIGTKQYKDVIADANILQGAIFHEDTAEDIYLGEESEMDNIDSKVGVDPGRSLQVNSNNLQTKLRPAAHKGFLARAKGIPALELYRLAQKKNRKLVLCGHSLGGAVAVLSTLAILRVVASPSSVKENERVQVKCITFSQPPVGNAALRDYVQKKGWQHYFKTYCIPEDLVPRILSPAYFQHYSSQALQSAVDMDLSGSSLGKPSAGGGIGVSITVKARENNGERLVLGLGPIQKSFWRLSKLVPLGSVQQQLSRFKVKRNELGEIAVAKNSGLTETLDEVEATPQSLDIQEGADGISLTPSDMDGGASDEVKGNATRTDAKRTEARRWRRVPSLPSYVPFGQVIDFHDCHMCSTNAEGLPSMPKYSSYHEEQPDLQKMRVIIGSPLRSARQQILSEYVASGFPSFDAKSTDPCQKFSIEAPSNEGSTCIEGLSRFTIYCTSDFITVSKEVFVRARRVRLLGLEGAGKTSLYNAIMAQSRTSTAFDPQSVHAIMDPQEGMAGGLYYADSAGVNLQDLHSEVRHLREELWVGAHQNRKIDLIVLVHNLSQKIPRYYNNQPDASSPQVQQPALSLLLNEVSAAEIPWVLAITNKFSVSADQQMGAVNAVLNAYQLSPSVAVVVNSHPYVTSTGPSAKGWSIDEGNSKGLASAQRFILAPINLVRMPFQRREVVLPVEGVNTLCRLIHHELLGHEETSLQELARERLSLELEREQMRVRDSRMRDFEGKGSSSSAAAVGASLGAGLGLVLAIVMGAGSALRKP
ncbi:hypothetical protein AMTRI_Chr06g173710 [Amborella trichopoda]